MSRRLLPTILAALALLAACATTDGGAPGEDTSVTPDTATAPDAVTVPDTVPDTATDAVTDAGSDTGSDTDSDTGSDSATAPDTATGPLLTDDPVVEEVATFYRTVERLPDLDVRRVLWAADTLWAGTPSGLYRYEAGEDRFVPWPLAGPESEVVDLATGSAAALAVAHPGGVTILDPATGDEDYVALEAGALCVAVGDGGVWAGGEAGAGPLGETWTATATPVRALAFEEDALYPVGATAQGLLAFGAGAPRPLTAAEGWLPDDDVRDVAKGPGGGLIAGTATGVALVRSDDRATLIVPALGEGQLPTDDLRAVAAWGEAFAMGHGVGATVRDPESPYPGHFDHYHSLRWLPADELRDVAMGPGGATWFATGAGISRIDRVARTLADKAVAMEAALEAHFWRMDGFVSSDASFPEAWSDQGPTTRGDKDNDGLWTQMQVGAWALAYGATGDPAYCEKARRAMANMFLLVDIPAVDFVAAGRGRGFVARSLVRDDEGAVFADKVGRPNWHLVRWEDGHDYYWKDDTSSDELAGHFFGFPLYHDLCAESPEEKAAVADRAGAIAAYVRDEGFRLIDLDGEQTGHGQWEPERLAIALDGLPACFAAGHSLDDCANAFGGGGWLNGTEVLGMMLAAWHMTGDDAFYEAYETLVVEHRYGELVDFQPTILTVTDPAVANHSDHELAMLAYFTLIRYEPDPTRRQRWIASMLSVYEYIRRERNGLWGLLVASAAPEAGGFEGTVRTLHEIPLDLRQMPYDKRHRKDVRVIGLDRFSEQQFDRALPYDENRTFWWNANPYKANDRGNLREWQSPMFWLLPYWGLRYYGVLP